jgi:predicted membrane-bound spermidine synthase
MEKQTMEAISNTILILYAIAAIAGGLGGCAAGCYYLTHDKRPQWAFVVAYMVLGVVFGVLTFALLSAYHFEPNLHRLVLYAAAGGLGGALALASANFTVRLLFRKLGLEIQFTMRKGKRNRRSEDDEVELP